MGDIRHKFITDAELHDPKGFGTASNKTVLTKDENGVSRYVATTVLEKALNFVDGNAAPPTEVLGAIYVLIDEGNGAVDSGWDGASYDDWVRFNGTTWVAYTPTDGTLCFNDTLDKYKVYDGGWDLLVSGIPGYTTAQIAALTPSDGDFVYDTTLKSLQRYNGSTWVSVANGYGVISINDSSGVPTFYNNMQTAVTAAGAGGTIHLHSNITQTSTVTLPSGTGISFTINGNGYTITHTSNTGSEYGLFVAGGSTQKLFLNNIKIVSNGTGTGSYQSAVFSYSPAIKEVICSSDTYIYALNSNIMYGTNSVIYGGKLEAVNGYVNFSATVRDARVTTKFTRGNVINCDVTVNTGGAVGLLATEIKGCTINGDASTNNLVEIDGTCEFWDNTVVCSTGNNDAIEVGGGASSSLNIQDVKVYHYGTGIGVNAVYIYGIKNLYVYCESGNPLYTNNYTVYSHNSYILENIILETNSTNKNAWLSFTNNNDFKVKNVVARCVNASNTKEAMNIRVQADKIITLIDCEAYVANAAVNNIVFTPSSLTTGGVYIYNTGLSNIGTGINYSTVPLLNTTTTDAYGNYKIG